MKKTDKDSSWGTGAWRADTLENYCGIYSINSTLIWEIH